jgi:hypothetical protein
MVRVSKEVRPVPPMIASNSAMETLFSVERLNTKEAKNCYGLSGT